MERASIDFLVQHACMKPINISELATSAVYHEILRVPALSLGLYRHAAGASVPQQPHAEDEVYFVISGRGSIRTAGTDHAVSSGAVVFVAAGIDHHFHSVTEELKVLVVFAPAEGITGGAASPASHSEDQGHQI
jgi:mannose-6-phosphate isomerase-like protein (cupin superfamily)